MSANCGDVVILLIDPDEAFRTALGAILREDGHPVLEFRSPAELPPPASLGGVDVAIDDCSRSEATGLAFAAEFRAAHPGVPLILLTACDAEGPPEPWRELYAVQVVPKPVEYEPFHALIHGLADRAGRPPAVAASRSAPRRGPRQGRAPECP